MLIFEEGYIWGSETVLTAVLGEGLYELMPVRLLSIVGTSVGREKVVRDCDGLLVGTVDAVESGGKGR